MPIYVFNPQAPHADPILPGPDPDGVGVCGKCLAVPRYRKLILPRPDSGASLLTQIFFAGDVVLNRKLSTFSADQLCQWTCPIDASAWGTGTGSWTFYWGSIAPPGGGLAASGWIAVANFDTGDPSTSATAAYICPDSVFFYCFAPNHLTFLPSPVR